MQNYSKSENLDKISVIIPVYYNADVLKETHSVLSAVLKEHSQKFDYELVFVDDGSKDESYRVMSEISASDERVKLVKLSKNHGAYVAILIRNELCNRRRCGFSCRRPAGSPGVNTANVR